MCMQLYVKLYQFWMLEGVGIYRFVFLTQRLVVDSPAHRISAEMTDKELFFLCTKMWLVLNLWQGSPHDVSAPVHSKGEIYISEKESLLTQQLRQIHLQIGVNKIKEDEARVRITLMWVVCASQPGDGCTSKSSLLELCAKTKHCLEYRNRLTPWRGPERSVNAWTWAHAWDVWKSTMVQPLMIKTLEENNLQTDRGVVLLCDIVLELQIPSMYFSFRLQCPQICPVQCQISRYFGNSQHV